MPRKRERLDPRTIDPGFNEIKPWLSQKLAERQLTVEQFCYYTGYAILPTSVWHWYSDMYRPYERKMDVVCKTLSRLPIICIDGSEYFEHIPLREGLATYAPKPRALAAHYLKAPTPVKNTEPATRRTKRTQRRRTSDA